MQDFINSGFRKIGFLVDSIGPGQVPYLCIDQCNKWLSQDFSLTFSLFYLENAQPCLQPFFARFHAKDAMAFTGHLIATSNSTLDVLKSCMRAKRYYYINDLTWINNPSMALQDKSIVKFTKCEDYYNKLKDSIEISQKIVKDFNISKVLEIINENQ